MAADDDYPAARARDHLLPAEQGAVAHAAQGLHEARGRAEEEAPPARRRAGEGHGEDLYVAVIHRVHADLSETAHRAELLRDAVVVERTQLFYGYEQDLRGRARAEGLFLNIVRQIGAAVAEGLVRGKLRLRGRDEFPALENVVNAAQRETPALLEEGAEHLAVHGKARGLQLTPEHLGLQRIVPAQGRITAGEQHEAPAGLARGAEHGAAYLLVRAVALRGGHGAGVRQDVEQPLALRKALADGALRPVRVDRDVVHRLNARGVVVQDDELVGVCGQLRGEGRVHGCLVHGRELLQYFNAGHVFSSSFSYVQPPEPQAPGGAKTLGQLFQTAALRLREGLEELHGQLRRSA